MIIRNSKGISLFHSFGIAEKDLKEVTQKDIR
jgi:hypothetical protein